MSASNGADWLSDNLLTPQPDHEATIRSVQKRLSEPERIDWPLTRDEGRMILAALAAASLSPVSNAGCRPGPELDALIEYACEYWGECDDPDDLIGSDGLIDDLDG